MSCPPETARLFFALDPDAEVRRNILAVRDALALPGRPVAAPNLHVTLAFLGDVPTTRIGELLDIGSRSVFPPCTLNLDHCGWFPRAAVAWLGSQAPPGELIAFRELLSGRLTGGGFNTDARPWQPHLTLYRKMRKPCARMDVRPVEWIINGFCLMQSTLTEKGAIYELLGRWQAAC